MILIIDTSNNKVIKLFLEENNKTVKKKTIIADRQQAEKLLPAIELLLKSAKADLREIEKIKVAHKGNSFTSLRIGVLTANALAYALGVRVETLEISKNKVKKLKDFNIVIPEYNSDPDIKIKKNELD
jgi:tRNA threonylcarbamoyl adenosine modification protein YeaZ